MFGLISGIPLGVKVTLSLLGLLVYLAYRYLTKYFDQWKKQGVIFEKPVPIFGTMTKQFLMQEHAAQWSLRMYKKYEGQPFVGVFNGRNPALLVMDPELIKNVLITDFSHFADHGFQFSEETDPLNAKNLFAMNGDRWKEMRHKLVPTFTSGKMKAMFPLMLECTEQFDERLNELAKENKMFEAKDLLGCLFTDIVGSCIFGISTNALKDPNNQFRKMAQKLTTVNFTQAVKAALVLFLPELSVKLKIALFEQEVTDFFRKLVKDIMEIRKKTKSSRKDFLQLLMELKEKGSISVDDEDEDKNLIQEENDTSSFRFGDDDVTAQATVFFLAGFETSSTALCYTLLELAANPDVQRKAQLEISEAMNESNGVVSYQVLKNLTYLDKVIQGNRFALLQIKLTLLTFLRKYTVSFCEKTVFPVVIDKAQFIMVPKGGAWLKLEKRSDE